MGAGAGAGAGAGGVGVSLAGVVLARGGGVGGEPVGVTGVGGEPVVVTGVGGGPTRLFEGSLESTKFGKK